VSGIKQSILLATLFFGKLMLGNDAELTYAFSSSGFCITLAVTLVFGWIASRIPVNRPLPSQHMLRFLTNKSGSGMIGLLHYFCGHQHQEQEQR